MIRMALDTLLAAVGDQRVKSLKKKYPELAEDIEFLAEYDPTEGKQVYLQWAVNKLRSGFSFDELLSALLVFHEAKKFLEVKDLNRYKTPDEVVEKSEEALQIEADAVQAERDAKHPTLVYSKTGLLIYQIFTKDQMIKIGRGSEWCVAHPGGTYWDKEYTVVPNWKFYVIDADDGRYLAFFAGDELAELRDWKNDPAPRAKKFLDEAGLLGGVG